MASLNSHRKLLQINSPPSNYSTSNNTTNDDNYTTVQTCLNNYCNPTKNTTSSPYSGFCPKVCLAICPSLCHYSFSTSPLPLDFTPTQPNKPHNNHSPLLISMLILLATTFLLISIYILYTKLYFNFYAPNNSNSNSFLQRRNDPLHEEHGHRVVFHPFWYISTVGLPTTAIQRIAVVKYGKSMEERDCAVCLAEFEEGEDLRVLPKCSHAFHLLCIDTWLSSHTTCPLCRAPIFPPDHHHHVDDQSNLTVENTLNSVPSTVEAATEDTSPDGELRVIIENINISTTREGLAGINNEEYCIDNLRRVDDNKRSYSQRWSLESGAVNMLSRSLSCSGKIFSSRCCNRP